MKTFHLSTARGRGGLLAPAVALGLTLCLAWTLLFVAGAAPAEAQVGVPLPVACPQIADPLPTGSTVRPQVGFNSNDPEYKFVHSATHLQGYPSKEKFAAGLLWNPPAPRELSGIQSVVVVTNPNKVSAAVTVEFYDEGGVMVGSVSFSIPAEGYETVPALQLAGGSPAGRGSARIFTTNGVSIVGETIHHMQSMDLGGFGGPILTDPDPYIPGAASVQQLQARQENKTALYFGPMPVSDQSNIDFLNGNAPAIWVMNPNSTPTTVSIGVFSRLGVNFGTVTVVLPAYASTIDLRLWNALWGPYLTGAINYDDDFLVVAVGTQPIIGEVVMTDVFSNGGGNLNLNGRFRMGSAMMANNPSLRLIDPELTYEAIDPGVETVIGISNAAAQDIGPVRIQYRDRNGATLGVDTIASFPQGAVARIGRGQAPSPNFPGPGVFDGSVRITACAAGLFGWTMRTSGDLPGVASTGFRKVWGEALAGANGLEPGKGFSVTDSNGQNWVRKVSPIVRVDPSWYWPGYTNFVNLSVANIGQYWYRFFTKFGTDVTQTAGQPFAGVQFGDTSFTYEDLLVDPNQIFFGANLSGRVDHTKGRIEGIHVLGDPLVEWGIFDSFPDTGRVDAVPAGD